MLVKFKIIFAKGYVPNLYEEVFLINKINDLNGEEIVGNCFNKNCKIKKNKNKKKKKKIKKSLELKK